MRIPLQAIIDFLYPETFGSQVISIAKKQADPEFSLRIPCVPKLKHAKKIRLAATILEFSDFTATALAEAIGVDKSQISRWKKTREWEQVQVFCASLKMQTAMESPAESFCQAAARLKVPAVKVFEWQGSAGRAVNKSLKYLWQAADSLGRLSKDKVLIERLQAFLKVEKTADEDYWREVLESEICDDQISEVLDQAPHPEWTRAFRLLRHYKEQQPEHPTEQESTVENPVKTKTPDR